jgi:hypothetical protein
MFLSTIIKFAFVKRTEKREDDNIQPIIGEKMPGLIYTKRKHKFNRSDKRTEERNVSQNFFENKNELVLLFLTTFVFDFF